MGIFRTKGHSKRRIAALIGLAFFALAPSALFVKTGLVVSSAYAADLCGMGSFEVGQVWSYQTRPEDEGSRLTIVKLEEHDLFGQIVHVSVDNVQVLPGSWTDIGHMPFSHDSIRDSVATCEKVAFVSPESLEGYETWREAFDRGDAGVFTISVAEAVHLIVSTVNANQ